MRKIITSVSAIVFAGALIVGGTGAFFSDTETSEANTFAAGAIDLQIDNSSYGFDWNDPTVTDPQGVWGENTANSWELNDLTNQLFFSFEDLKPGDYGEDTISLHVTDNDAYACMAFNQTGTPDNSINEPEADAGDVTDGADGGELQNYLSFLFWMDDGDNILEEGEQVIDSLSGLSSDIFTGNWLAIAESGDTPLTGAETQYIGKGWCFGDIVEDREVQDNTGDGAPTANTTGFTCTGAAGDHNDAQTDGIEVDVAFYAVQARNNDDFSCAALPSLEDGDPEPEELIGAALGDFTALVLDSAECDATVGVGSGANDFATIQEAIDDVGTVNGDTVCVADGVYDEDVTINKEIALSGDGADTTSVINGQTAAVGGTVLIAADNVTVEGFEINGIGGTANDAAIYISGARTGATIRSNELNAGAGGLALLAEGGQTNHLVQNNLISGSASPQVAYINGLASVSVASDNVDFLNNTFGGTVIGGGLPLGLEASNSSIEQNVFDITSTYSVIEAWMDSIVLHENNFNGVGGIKVTQAENGNTGLQGTVDAENNWWGDADGTDNIAGDVDFDPEAPAPFPEN